MAAVKSSPAETGQPSSLVLEGAPSSLAQVPGLEPLELICHEFKVEITAYGSLVRRLFAATDGPHTRVPDLFQLSPLLSDIDLRHSGSREDTQAIRRKILGSVRCSECFRWEIFSDEELARFRADEVHLPIIPANKLELATMDGRGIRDRWEGKADIHRAWYRLIRNGFLDRSTQVQEGRDGELLYALRYLHLLAEMLGEQDPEAQPGWGDCSEIIHRSHHPKFVITLQDYSRLRARIRYRLKAIRSATQSAGTWQKITSHSGLRNLLTYLDEKGAFGKFPVLAELDPPESSPLVSSSWLGGDAFRLEAAAAPWKWGEKAKVQWESVRARHQPLDVLCPKALAPLSAGHRILAASPVVPLTPGRAASALDQEHVHFQVCPDDEAAAACRRAGEESLGVILVLTANLRDQAHGERLHSCAIPLSGCCFLQPYGMEDDYWSIKADDLVDAAALAARIKAQTDPLSAWLWKHLGDGAQKRLDEPGDEGKASPGAVHVIREVLNEFLDADPTGLVGDFTGSPLPAQSLELLRTATERGDSARVCREIIEQVYPKAIRRRPKSDLLLQIRLDCGHLLESFPDLVAKAELGRVKGHFLQIYVSSAHS